MDAAVPADWPSAPTRFVIPGPAGPIECVASGGPPVAGKIAVLCHPHSLHGGSMDNKVVVMLERALRELGAATLRLNFRGVGASGGVFDHGIGESEDLAAVVALARRWAPAAELWLGAFSFGGYVATRMADALDARLLITVAPAVSRFAFTQIPRPRARWIVLQGEVDEVVDPALVFAHFDQMQPPVEMLRFADTGHFFHGKLVQMRDRVSAQIAAAPGSHPA